MWLERKKMASDSFDKKYLTTKIFMRRKIEKNVLSDFYVQFDFLTFVASM